MWLVLLHPLAFQGVAHFLERFFIQGRRRAAHQVRHGEVAVFIQRLAMAQADGGSRRAPHLEMHDSSQVLAKVEHRVSVRRLQHHRREGFLAPHRNPHRGHQVIFGMVGYAHSLPFLSSSEPRAAPAGHFQARVVNLAILHIGFQYRPSGRFPLLIRPDGDPVSVLRLNLEQRQQPQPIAVHVTRIKNVHLSAVPAIAQDGPDHIFTLLQQAGNVIHLVLEHFIVWGVPGGEELVADTLSVEPGLI